MMDKPTQNKKAYWIMGVVLVLLALMALFVYLDNRANWLRPTNQTLMGVNLEILLVLVNLTLVGIGGVYGFAHIWKGKPKSISYDIGLRLVATGYVVSVLSALADYTGVGSHHTMPFFGSLQTAGVFLGEAVIAIGFLLMFLSQIHE
jgi:uncharacterized membrane protein